MDEENSCQATCLHPFHTGKVNYGPGGCIQLLERKSKDSRSCGPDKGRRGVGKTAVSKFFVKNFTERLKGTLQPAYVNCKRKSFPNLVLRRS